MENSKLKVFLPFFYLVWSDDLLTQKEHLILKEFIVAQNWLSTEEKQLLVSQIAISNVPSRSMLNTWKTEIDKALKQNPSARSIFDIVLELSENNIEIRELATDFIQLESDLGILGEDVISNFKKNATTFTSTYH